MIALLAMGAPQTPPLKTHLMSFTSKGAIFREVKISQKSEHVTARAILRLSTLSADFIGYGGVCDQEGSAPPKSTPCHPPTPCTAVYI